MISMFVFASSEALLGEKKMEAMSSSSHSRSIKVKPDRQPFTTIFGRLRRRFLQ
jgi:hypothetical protein